MALNKHGVDDMVMLSKVSEESINDNLKKRYDNDLIYTYIGHVLISLNPFKQIKGLYSERTLKDYRGKYRYELPPHVYALADDMYRQMLSEGENQCVIISGESGAGKTEASKVIMQYIAAVSGKSEEVVRVKDIILESNPLLEAFGNAKTMRNNNSSRFGKYMEIQFDRKGDPEGGRVTNYLLEKSRVVFQTQGERNFHIFYQILAGARGDRELAVQNTSFYNYLNKSGCSSVDGIDDAQEFTATMNAMKAVGINEYEQKEILRLCMAILWIGQITFKSNQNDESSIEDHKSLEMVANLLQSTPSACEKAFTFRTISTGTENRSARVSTYACPQSVEGALYSRDALAKGLYTKLFDWIIYRLNEGLDNNDPDAFTIGVLDIYGFEIFEKNGFEQLCINYVNEKLQQIFIELTLKAEQEEYAAENIPWEPVPYFNNKICCDLIESKQKPIGVFALLDDVCQFPKGTDQVYLEKLMKAFVDHPHIHGGDRDNDFVIKHYAGDVSYCVEGFVDKNKDLLFNDLIGLAHQTSSTFLPQLFPEAGNTDDKRRPSTAGFKIKESIGYLMKALTACNPHYIRCIKPNNRKARNDFDTPLVNHQVRYLGLLENVRVRRAGFAYRQTYDKFFYRYRVICNKTWPSWSGDHKSGCLAILQQMHLEASEYQQGTTKIFVRHPETVFNLEELRERTVYVYANKIQRFFLMFSLRRYFWELAVAGNNAIQGKKERRRASVENRAFHGDYIQYRENFELKALVNKNGEEKVMFADNVNKYDRRCRRQRRILVITNVAIYLFALEKNKDKTEKKKKPWAYLQKRRILVSTVACLRITTCQDNFLVLAVPGEHDTLMDNRRKTEIIATVLKLNSSVRIEIGDTLIVAIKKSGKRKINVSRDPSAGEGKMKGRKIVVAPGLPKETVANLPEPKQAATISSAQLNNPKGILERKKAKPKGADFRPSLGRGAPPPQSKALQHQSSFQSALQPPLQPSEALKPSPPKQTFQRSVSQQQAKSYMAAVKCNPQSQSFSSQPHSQLYPQSGKLTRGPSKLSPGKGSPSTTTSSQSSSTFSSSYLPPAASSTPSPSPAKIVVKAQIHVPKQAPQRPRVLALYDFDAENPDELTFKEGDIIELTDKVSDPEWWKGILNGFEGLFPAIYVSELPSSPRPAPSKAKGLAPATTAPSQPKGRPISKGPPPAALTQSRVASGSPGLRRSGGARGPPGGPTGGRPPMRGPGPERGLPVGGRGPPVGGRGPPVGGRGPPVGVRGPPVGVVRGPPIGGRGPAVGGRPPGPPRGRGGPPRGRG